MNRTRGQVGPTGCMNGSGERQTVLEKDKSISSAYQQQRWLAVPLLEWSGYEAPRFQDNRHIKVVKLSALRTGCLYPPGNIPGTHFG
jgi:hypothetical protein